MDARTPSNSPILNAYVERTRASARLFEQAREVLPSGIAHDVRRFEPYGIYTDHAEGARKWDVDGNEYIDYFGGHGALLLGNAHPEVTAAVESVLAQGSHFGTNHPLEVRWAQAVHKIIPSAERVRFTSSGTEATLLALRLARAFTGKQKIVRFRGHFHGWHDHMTSGFISHFDGAPTTGVLPGLADQVCLMDTNDMAGVRELLAGDSDIAAVILEPTGGSFGMIPTEGKFLAGLRNVTTEHGVILIFDEVITGFRVCPGGAQSYYDIMPDLTTLGKIVAGGLPGAALVGRKDILDLLDFEATAAKGVEKVLHFGTFNGNPVSAAAGFATLRIVKTGRPCDRANNVAQNLRWEMNEILAKHAIPWAAYGTFSAIHIFTNTAGRDIDHMNFDPHAIPIKELMANPTALVDKLRMALLVNGVDMNGWPGGLTSAAHTDEDVRETLEAFERSLVMLKDEGEFA